LSSQSTPSPSFPRGFYGAIAFLYFPILSVIWTLKCIRLRKSEGFIFALLGTLGLWITWIFFHGIKRDLGLVWILSSIIGYLFIWAIHFIFTGMVQDEIERRKPV
jgi:hypothetical protein